MQAAPQQCTVSSETIDDVVAFYTPNRRPDTIQAFDLAGQLRECIATVPGGRDKRGGPIMCFPSTSRMGSGKAESITLTLNSSTNSGSGRDEGANRMTLESLRTLIAYLAYVPNEDARRAGFSVIVDLRGSRWHDVKPLLRLLDECLSDCIHRVFVIKPDRFWEKQKANLDLTAKTNKFNYEIQLCTLESLMQFIDASQLTAEFDGSLPFSHEEWLASRMRVEDFFWRSQFVKERFEQLHAVLADGSVPQNSLAAKQLMSENARTRDRLHLAPIDALHNEALELVHLLKYGSTNNFAGGVSSGVCTSGVPGTSWISINPDFQAVIPDVQRVVDSLQSSRNALLQIWHQKRTQLEQFYQLRLFEEDCAKLRDWLAQNRVLFAAQCANIGQHAPGDPDSPTDARSSLPSVGESTASASASASANSYSLSRNSDSTLQPHDAYSKCLGNACALQEEHDQYVRSNCVAARENIERIAQIGVALAKQGHFAADYLKSEATRLDAEWCTFADALSHRTKLLALSVATHKCAHEYSSHIGNWETAILHVQPAVQPASASSPKKEPEATSGSTQLEALETGMRTVKELWELIKRKHHDVGVELKTLHDTVQHAPHAHTLTHGSKQNTAAAAAAACWCANAVLACVDMNDALKHINNYKHFLHAKHSALERAYQSKRYRLQYRINLLTFKEDEKQVYEWIGEHGEKFLNKLEGVGCTVDRAYMLYHALQQFQNVAQNTFTNTEKLLAAAEEIILQLENSSALMQLDASTGAGASANEADEIRAVLVEESHQLQTRVRLFFSRIDEKQRVLETSINFHTHVKELLDWYKELEDELSSASAQNSLQDLMQSWQSNTIEQLLEQLDAQREASTTAYVCTVSEASTLTSYLKRCLAERENATSKSSSRASASSPTGSATSQSEASVAETDLKQIEGHLSKINEYRSRLEEMCAQRRRTLDCFLQVRLLERDVDEFVARRVAFLETYSNVVLEADVNAAERQLLAHKEQLSNMQQTSLELVHRAETMLGDLNDGPTKRGSILRIELKSATERHASTSELNDRASASNSRNTVELNVHINQLIDLVRRVQAELEWAGTRKTDALDDHCRLLELSAQGEHVVGWIRGGDQMLRASFLIPSNLREAELFKCDHEKFQKALEKTHESAAMCVQTAEQLLQSLATKQSRARVALENASALSPNALNTSRRSASVDRELDSENLQHARIMLERCNENYYCVQKLIDTVTVRWQQLVYHAEERHKLIVASINWYRTAEQVYFVLDNLLKEYRRTDDWCQATKASNDEEKMQQLLGSMTRHMEKKEAFLKACTLARRTAESFMKYAHRNIPLACGISNASSSSPNSSMTTSMTARSAKAVDASVKQMLEQLFVQEEAVLEAWSARKKRLEHCLQYLQFDFWVKDMTETLSAADLAVSNCSTPGSIDDTTSLGSSNNQADAVALLRDVAEKMQSMQQYVQQCETSLNAHTPQMRTLMQALERRSRDLHRRDKEQQSAGFSASGRPLSIVSGLSGTSGAASASGSTSSLTALGGTASCASISNESNASSQRTSGVRLGKAAAAGPAGKLDAVAERRRQYIMSELLQTERTYVKDLETCIKTYLHAFSDPQTARHVPAELNGRQRVIFSNIEDIFSFHHHIFLRELEKYESLPEDVGHCFVTWAEQFSTMYVEYCKSKQESNKLIVEHGTAFFDDLQKRHQLPEKIDSYLIKPVQRITKYQLLLKDLMSTFKSDQDNEIKDGLEVMLSVPKKANDALHLSMLEGVEASECGDVLLQDSFQVWDSKQIIKKAHERRVFLFDNCLLIAKETKDSGGRVHYVYKTRIYLSSVGITEHVEGDACKFAVWLGAVPVNAEYRLVLKARDLDTKQSWIKTMRESIRGRMMYALYDTTPSSSSNSTVQALSLNSSSTHRTSNSNVSTSNGSVGSSKKLSSVGLMSFSSVEPSIGVPDSGTHSLSTHSNRSDSHAEVDELVRRASKIKMTDSQSSLPNSRSVEEIASLTESTRSHFTIPGSSNAHSQLSLTTEQ